MVGVGAGISVLQRVNEEASDLSSFYHNEDTQRSTFYNQNPQGGGWDAGALSTAAEEGRSRNPSQNSTTNSSYYFSRRLKGSSQQPAGFNGRSKGTRKSLEDKGSNRRVCAEQNQLVHQRVRPKEGN